MSEETKDTGKDKDPKETQGQTQTPAKETQQEQKEDKKDAQNSNGNTEEKEKPKYKKLTITKIVRTMKGGAILSFKGNFKDIEVDTQKYRVGDTYRKPITAKPKKKK